MGYCRQRVATARGSIATVACAVVLFSSTSSSSLSLAADDPAQRQKFFPDSSGLTLQQEPESIYAPPQPPREDEGVNEGGVHIDLTVRYMSDYVYRGIDFSEVGGAEDAPNLQVDGKVAWDLGKLPHPYIGVFVNVYDSDPISRFQEVRPSFGVDWPIKPLLLSAGNNTYIYPERDEMNTSEVYGRIELDDSFLFSSQRPMFSPYIYAAYDYDLYNGWYFEGGIRHDFVFEDTGFVLTALADVAYVMGEQQYLLHPATSRDDVGFQHYDIGLIGAYSLNTLFNFSRRYGEFSIEGYLYYTDSIEHDLRADTQLWGGVGIHFRY
jgi:hypothetical protein